MERVVLRPSPCVQHKYRVMFPSRRAIDFGDVCTPHYPDHGNPKIMRAQLLRKGAIVPEELRIETDPREIHRGMLKIRESSIEDWDDIYGAEYWERWILHTHNTVTKAKLSLLMSHGVLFVPEAQDLWNT